MSIAIPAATLILFRDGPEGPEHLFVERAATMRFAGGAIVFPGGRIDPEDHERAVARPGPDDAAARIAAIRETREETAIDLGDDLMQLVPFARWCPHHPISRTFDTHFYLARLPDSAGKARVDATENVRLFWARAADVLARADAGALRIIFPTRRNLERLAQFGSFDEAVAHAASHPVRTITPWVATRDGADVLCIPDDLGYPITQERLNKAERG